MESGNLHGQIFDAVRDPLVVVDGRGDVYAANAAALRLFDLPGASGEPSPSGPARLALDVRMLASLVRRGQRMQGVPLSDRGGRDTGVVVDIDPGIGPDGHSLLHFHARTEALARELWSDDAVATVAHEFRNPLSAMRTALDLLASGDAGPVSENQRRFIDTVQRGAVRLGRIVDGYLDLARVREGALPVNRGDHDARVLIAGFTNDLAIFYPGLAERMDVDIARDVQVAYMDPDRITQVLLNLVCNAARFTPEGKRLALRASRAGREGIEDALRVLPWELLGEPRFLRLNVEDQGIGMTAGALAHIFDRYHTGHRDAADTGAGAHLGLYIARALVGAHDGWIHLESHLGEGTTASVFVPENTDTARLLSRLRAAELAVQRLRAARRSVTVALIADHSIGVERVAPPAWPHAWVVNPVRPDDGEGRAMIWVVRDGVALLVTPSAASVPAPSDPDGATGTAIAVGACTIDAGMTFSGALRAAASALLEQASHRYVRAVTGLETVRE